MSSNRQQNRAEINRVARFVRAMERLPTEWIDRPGLGIAVAMKPEKMEIVEAPAWESVENLLARFRPIYLDSEDSSFRSVVEILPRHGRITNGGPLFSDLEFKWDAILDSFAAPIPPGARIVECPGVPPGYVGTSGEGARIEFGFDGRLHSNRELLELSIYGTLVHADRDKERKRVRIQRSFLEPAYRVLVMGTMAELFGVADTLRAFSVAFLEGVERHFGPGKVEEIEAEFDPPEARAESRTAGYSLVKVNGRTVLERKPADDDDPPDGGS